MFCHVATGSACEIHVKTFAVVITPAASFFYIGFSFTGKWYVIDLKKKAWIFSSLLLEIAFIYR